MSDTPSNFKAIYRRLVAYTFNYWNIFLFAVMGMILVAASQPGFAALMEPLLDGSFVNKDPDVNKWMPLLILGVFLIRAFGGVVSEYCMNWIGRMVIRDIRNDMFNKLMLLPGDYFDSNSTGNTISKFTYDVEQVAQAATNAITILIRDVLMVVGLFAYMFYLSALLASVFLAVGPFIALIIALVSKRFRNVSKRIQKTMGKVTHVLEEAIQAQRVVKIFGGQKYETSQFSDSNDLNRRQNMKMAAATSISTPVIQVIVSIALAGIIMLATQESMKEKISVGEFMAFMSAMLMLFAPIKRLTNVNAILQRGVAAADSIFNFIDDDIENDCGDYVAERVAGEIEFNGISFSYASNLERTVLNNIQLTIKAGQTVAFVGRSGSGKSTLVNLLPRLYDSYQGEIRIDGRDSRSYTLESLRDQIAYVGQEIILFNDTVEHNIAYGRLHDYSEQEVIAAAQSAHAYDFIQQMKNGLQTVVGEKGVMLSGGQRQRIAIARALLKNAPILILDEATSALDTESERHIQSALEELIKNRTTLVIAHRLSTIEKADLIVVMDGGNIVETGSHKELLAANGHYASLHKMQFTETR